MVDTVYESLASGNLTESLHQFAVNRVHRIDHEVTAIRLQLGFPVNDMVQGVSGSRLVTGPTHKIVFIAALGLVQSLYQGPDDRRTAAHFNQAKQIGINGIQKLDNPLRLQRLVGKEHLQIVTADLQGIVAQSRFVRRSSPLVPFPAEFLGCIDLVTAINLIQHAI